MLAHDVLVYLFDVELIARLVPAVGVEVALRVLDHLVDGEHDAGQAAHSFRIAHCLGRLAGDCGRRGRGGELFGQLELAALHELGLDVRLVVRQVVDDLDVVALLGRVGRRHRRMMMVIVMQAGREQQVLVATGAAQLAFLVLAFVCSK